VDTRLSVLPLSTITLHTLSLVLQAVLNKFFLWTGFSISFSGFKIIFLIIKDLLPSTSSASTFFFCASKMELRLPYIFLYQDIPRICVLYSHRQTTLLHLLCLFLFLLFEEKCSCRHIVFLVKFLPFLGGYEVSSLHPWDFSLCPGKFLFLFSDFYLYPFDLDFGPISLLLSEQPKKNLPHI
jgi:hypothetical protein